MPFTNLRTYLNALKNRGDLVEVDAPVDANLEIAEIHRRVIAAGGPALLFTKVKGSRFPVVTNLFGSEARVDLAFGREPKQFIETVARLPDELLPPSLGKLWGVRHLGRKALKIGMRRQRMGAVCAETIANHNLSELPALTSWPEDGGPFLTLPLVHTKSPEDKADNLGMYRMQIHDSRQTGMHFQIGKGGGYHLYEAEAKHQALPVNVYLGGPPALTLSAIAPLPEHVPELLLASLLAGEKIKTTAIPGHPLPAIAEAEFCLVGAVPAGIRKPEGPFGDHYGYYSLAHDYPVFQVQKIFHKRDAVFPATVVGKPRQEDFFLGDYLQELLTPLIKLVMPTVAQLWSYGETGYHSLAGVILKERFQRESLTSIFRILGEGQLSLSKFLLATDQATDIKDFKGFLAHILARSDFSKDLIIFGQTAMDSLDYAGPKVNHGSKGVLMGMGAPKRQLPVEFSAANLPNFVKGVQVFCPGCLVVEIPAYEADKTCIEELAKIAEFKDWPLLVAVDNGQKATQSTPAFLWTTFTRFDPAGDIYPAHTELNKHTLRYQPPIAIDARMKPWYPKELFCDDSTKKQVSSRWSEYFPGKKVAMGSSDYGHL